MTNREIALKLAKQACFEGEGPSLDWSKAARPIEAALDSAKRAGKIAVLEELLDEFQAVHFARGPIARIKKRLENLRAEQAKERP